MDHINKIEPKDIQRLDPDQLVELLHILLNNETLTKLPLTETYVSVPRPITMKDGGEDARVQFDLPKDFKLDSKWIKEPFACFQSKAKKMSDADCYNELVISTGTSKILKPMVESIFNANGEYILFTTDVLSEEMIASRIQKMRDAISDSGKTYSAVAKIKIRDANQIANWVNEYIGAVTYVQFCLKINRPVEFRTWEEWDRDFQQQKKFDFREPQYLLQLKKEFFELINKNKVVRILGKSGIGKTRFILELFSSDVAKSGVNPNKDLVVYIDLAVSKDDVVTKFLLSHRDVKGILIVDNCSEQFHKVFAGWIQAYGNLTLVTIDYDLRTQEKSTIFIEREKQFETVRAICESKFQDWSPEVIEKIITATEGFPEMIGIIESAFKGGTGKGVYEDIPPDFIKRYLFGRDEVDIYEYELLKSCSVFTHFKFYDDHFDEVLSDKEKETIKKQEYLLCQIISKKKFDITNFYRFCVKYRDHKKLLEQRGLNLKVIPEPIAATLAADWWLETSLEHIKTIATDITDAGLLTELCDRLADLDQLSKARDIVAKLWDPKSPFASAEVLNTELGSRLFRSVVEVNPESTCNTLFEVFGKLTKVQLLKIGPGRRHLVWALEKLCFRKETFSVAAKIMYAFAVSETENYANNASGQFTQLFQYRLPGTEVNYNERIKIIDYGLSKEDDEYTKLAIYAMSRGLQMHGITRMGGAEEQGSGRPLQDYRPKTDEEVKTYFTELYNRLILIARKNPDYIDLIKEQMARNIRDTIEYFGIDFVRPFLEEMIEVDSSTWYQMIHSLRIVVKNSGLSEYEVKVVNELLKLLQPKDIAGQIQTLVSKPDWDHDKIDDGSIVNKAEGRASAFAEQIIKEKVDLVPYLEYLVRDEQRQGFHFGKKFGELYGDKKTFINQTVNCIKSTPKENQNFEFLMGLLENIEDEERRKIIYSLLEDDKINSNSIYLARRYLKTKQDLDKLIALFKKGTLNVQQIKVMTYVAYEPAFELADLIKMSRIIYLHNEEGKWVALEMLSHYCYRDKDKYLQIKDVLREFVFGFNYFTSSIRTDVLNDYTFSQLVRGLFKFESGNELAELLSSQMLEYFRIKRPSFSDLYVAEISRVLIQKYFPIFWDNISKGILEKGVAFFNIQYVLGAHQGNFQTYEKKGALFEGDNNLIIEWCKQNKPIAPIKIAYIMPISKKDENKNTEWHPFALRMIDEFGEVKGFLEAIENNMRSFGWTGSTVPYYQSLKSLMEKIKDHKFQTVVEWSKDMIRRLDITIKRESIDDEERFIS